LAWRWAQASRPIIWRADRTTLAKGVAAGVVALAVFASALAAVGLSVRFLSGYSAVRRYLADASYWIYILHLPLVMLAQVWMQDWAGPWWLKLGGVSLGVFAVCLVSYELLIRHSVMGRWLNGRRVPWRRPVQPVLAPAE
jgi:glucan biosynthesis protein C